MNIYNRFIDYIGDMIISFIDPLPKKKTGYNNCMKGIFKPKNISKYKGNPTNIVYRSSWELKMMLYFDKHPDVIWWQSEETVIPYRSPVDRKLHRYFVDFTVKIKNAFGKINVYVIEVKPKYQTVPPVKPKKMNKTYIRESLTYGVNEAKWEAAKEYCADRKYEFMIMTENEIFSKFSF